MHYADTDLAFLWFGIYIFLLLVTYLNVYLKIWSAHDVFQKKSKIQHHFNWIILSSSLRLLYNILVMVNF